MKPSDLGLPYPEWYPSQWETITAIVTAPTPIVIVEAPPGIGKSGIAYAVSRILKADMIVLTGTKQLQDQYKTLPQMTDVRGRNNFSCNANPRYTADKADCTFGEPCDLRVATKHLHYGCPEDKVEPGKNVCPVCISVGPRFCQYYDQRFIGERSERVVTSYAYWLAMVNHVNSFTGARLLVCDEAQVMDEEIRRFAAPRFMLNNMKVLGTHLDMPVTFSLIPEWQDWGKSHVNEALLVARSSDEERYAAIKFLKAVHLLCSMPAEKWIGRNIAGPGGVASGSVEFLPIWSRDLFDCFRKGMPGPSEGKTLMMSGTILDPELFCWQLGLTPEEVTFIQVPSTFPAANRPFRISKTDDKVSTRSNASMEVLVKQVDDILAAHPNEKGIIHTVSYRLAEFILAYSKHGRRLVTHSPKNKPTQLAGFRSDVRPMVWISPSSMTGLDLPYDECRFQIICKIPFPDKSDPQIVARFNVGTDEERKMGRRSYAWATLCSLIQAYGRVMRAPDDNGTTYLLDGGNWRWFSRSVRDIIPTWVRQGIRKYTPPSSIENDNAADDLIRRIHADIEAARETPSLVTSEWSLPKLP